MTSLQLQTSYINELNYPKDVQEAEDCRIFPVHARDEEEEARLGQQRKHWTTEPLWSPMEKVIQGKYKVFWMCFIDDGFMFLVFPRKRKTSTKWRRSKLCWQRGWEECHSRGITLTPPSKCILLSQPLSLHKYSSSQQPRDLLQQRGEDCCHPPGGGQCHQDQGGSWQRHQEGSEVPRQESGQVWEDWPIPGLGWNERCGQVQRGRPPVQVQGHKDLQGSSQGKLSVF